MDIDRIYQEAKAFVERWLSDVFGVDVEEDAEIDERGEEWQYSLRTIPEHS